ncbi:MAG: RNA polymerase sigma factor [Patescibacteria group bacterium]
MENKIIDKQIIDAYLRGDEKSLEILVKKYIKPIYHFILYFVGNKPDAEDLTQDVFVKVWKNLKKFDSKKSFKTWIFSIAKNTSIDFLRKKKNIPFSEFENDEGANAIVDTIADPGPLLNEIFEDKEKSGLIASAMEKLSLTDQKTLSLRYNNEYSFREMSEILNKPVNTVKSRCRRALLNLKKILK